MLMIRILLSWILVKIGANKIAFKLIIPFAVQGEPNSQTAIGSMYETGSGVAANYPEAIKWYQLAAERGFSNAQYNLALMYANGRGGTANNIEAIKWYRLAATQGNSRAQSNLGLLYDEGNIVPQDYLEAAKWYRLAPPGVRLVVASEFNLKCRGESEINVS